MSRLIVLDSGPLSLASNPNESDEARQCNQWLQAVLSSGSRVMVPEIVEYEILRELLRADKGNGVKRLMGQMPPPTYRVADTT
jgi:predicted nucleic acid-binding protein